MSTGAPIIFIWGVALRKESVDRNGFDIVQLLTGHVALRKESVDRNHPKPTTLRMC